MSALAGVLLAAGRGRRMGRPKGLVEIAGEPALARLARVYLEARLAPVIAVVNPETRPLADTLPGVTVVEGDGDAPMVDSIARAIAALPAATAGIVVQPVDAPFTAVEMIAALRGGDRPRVLCHRSVPGHPVMVPRGLFARVLERPDGGLRALLAEAEIELVEWPDRRVLADLDTPADMAAWVH